VSGIQFRSSVTDFVPQLPYPTKARGERLMMTQTLVVIAVQIVVEVF
jgi:hypothetical protein